jgi:hypothetical protein
MRVQEKRGHFTSGITEYFTYTPKVIANVSGIDSILRTRCIEIVMIKGTQQEIGRAIVAAGDPVWQEMRDRLHVFGMQKHKEVRETMQSLAIPQYVTGRELELILPIAVLGNVCRVPTDDLVRRFHESYAVYSVLDEAIQNLITVVIETIDEGHGTTTLKEISERYARRFELPEWLKNRNIAHHLRLLGLDVRGYDRETQSKKVLLSREWRDKMARTYPHLAPAKPENMTVES